MLDLEGGGGPRGEFRVLTYNLFANYLVVIGVRGSGLRDYVRAGLRNSGIMRFSQFESFIQFRKSKNCQVLKQPKNVIEHTASSIGLPLVLILKMMPSMFIRQE